MKLGKMCLLAFYFCAISLLGACSGPLATQKQQVLMDYNESAIKSGKGAVVMHAINKGSIIATRWYKVDKPQVRENLTSFHSGRHRSIDKMSEYDVVTLEPGTYILYAVFSNCPEGLRSSPMGFDEPIRDNVATDMGMVYQIQTWAANDVATSVGVWGGNRGGGVGLGFNLGRFGTPGLPIATCGLTSRGVTADGKVILASITVKPGEVVYAGELNIDFSPTSTCDDSGNWLTQNETRSYCGLQSVSLSVADAYNTHARAFIESRLGAAAAQRAVIRLARPGIMASSGR